MHVPGTEEGNASAYPFRRNSSLLTSMHVQFVRSELSNAVWFFEPHEILLPSHGSFFYCFC